MQDNLALARRTGDDKKLRQVASRQKKLDERMGMERNDKGHRLQINRCFVRTLFLVHEMTCTKGEATYLSFALQCFKGFMDLGYAMMFC